MNSVLRMALDRTLLLMRDELIDSVSDDTLIDALTNTEIVLTAGRDVLKSHTAQCAFVTTALLLTRSGHRVYLNAPNGRLIGAQAPLMEAHLIDALMETNDDILPGSAFAVRVPAHTVDAEIIFDASSPGARSHRTMRVGATAWRAHLSEAGQSMPPSLSMAGFMPFGGLGASAMAASEIFKISMTRLAAYARNRNFFDELFAPSMDVTFAFAPDHCVLPPDLGKFDCISGGAITSSALYCLSRIPRVRGIARVIEPERGDLSNLNRYPLMRVRDIDERKACQLANLNLGRLIVESVPSRFDARFLAEHGSLNDHILVGVDHIPSRWNVQRQHPKFLAVGATTHWAAMASAHMPGTPCAGCAHPIDDPLDGPIPTVAFVSFWAGLLVASHFARSIAGEAASRMECQTYLSPLHPERPFVGPLSFRGDCPVAAHPLIAA